MHDHILLLPHQNTVPAGFTLQTQGIVIAQYQLYAVERYILQRTLHQHLLVVFTGDPAHSITLDAFVPDAQRPWSDTLALLRSDGARARNTPHGVLVVTSLAPFRSDYNIVKIPAGNYLAVRDQLYTNVNLLRMGCSGRTALTLEDPSDVAKDRFINAYHLAENTITPVPNPASIDHLPLPPALTSTQNPTKSPPLGLGRTSTTPTQTWRTPDKTPNHSTSSLTRIPKDREKVLVGRTRDSAAFVPTVLELVKLVQAGLTIFGFFPDVTASVQPGIFLDGLLCDNTVKGIKKWTVQIGGPCVGLEPTERIADPSFVSALLSLVLATRNKLAHLGYAFILPRDPFLHPYAFSTALNAYIQATAPPSIPAAHTQHHHHTFSSPHHSIHVAMPIIPAAPPPNSILSASAAAAAALATSSATSPPPASAVQAAGAVLTHETVDAIAASYDAKQRSESRKVGRVLKTRIAAAVDSDGDNGITGGRPTRAMTRSLSDGEGEYSSAHLYAYAQQALSHSTGSSSAQGVLSGIGSSLARGGAALTGIGGTEVSGDTGTLTNPTLDLAAFAHFVVGRTAGGKGKSATGDGGGGGVVSRTKGRARRLSRDIGAGVDGRRRESLEQTLAATAGDGAEGVYVYEKERAGRDGGVGASVKALFGGRVVDLMRMREEVESAGLDGPERCGAGGVPLGAALSTGSGASGGVDGKRWLGGLGGDRSEKEKEKEKARRKRGLSPGSVASDEDADARARERQQTPYDGRSTEEESDVVPGYMLGHAHGHSFGGMWTGRMRGKLGNWAGLARRKHQSVDLSASSSIQSSTPVNSASTTTTAIASSSKGKGKGKGKGKETDSESTQKAKEKESSNTASPQPSLLSNYYNNNSPANSAANRQRPTRLSMPAIGRRASERSASRAQSPTLPPMVFSNDADRDADDDDLLSSGQVSPLNDDRPSVFGRNNNVASGASSTTNLTVAAAGLSALDDPRGLTQQLLLAQKRGTRWPARRLTQSARIASWADPVSARDEGEGEEDGGGAEEDEDDSSVPRLPFARGSRSRSASDEEEGEESDVSRLGGYLAPRRGGSANAHWKRSREKARFHSLLSVVDGAGVLAEEPLEDSEYEEDEEEEELVDGDDVDVFWRRRKAVGFDPRRRRSFHDLDTFRDIEVLSKAHMEIDVEICSELLIMRRREEHLCNVIACVKILSESLSNTNTALREHYESHLSTLPDIEARAVVLAQLDAEHPRVNKIYQETNIMRYEGTQFSTGDLWQTARPSRRKVFEMREKVFGAGGRRLPAGVHGAHGTYDRLQWTLDGRERLVDHFGRTESEADEEAELEAGALYMPPDEEEQAAGATPAEEGEEEENVVEHPGIKPMWLLRFFTSWGARWSAAASAPPAAKAEEKDATEEQGPMNFPKERASQEQEFMEALDTLPAK